MRPRAIQIETTAYCQANCAFCPHDTMVREKGIMDMDLFEKIVDDAGSVGIRTFYLFLNGEPFTDGLLMERIRYVLEVVTKPTIYLYTNLGVPVTDSMLDTLKKCKLVVSIADGVSESIRADNLKALHDAGVPLTAHVVQRSSSYESAWDLLEDYGYDIPLQSFVIYNWRGKVDSPYPFKDGICYRVGKDMCVLWDGRVCLCCMDIDGEVILGDLGESTIADIWHSKKAVMYRTTPKSQLDFCKVCNMPVEGMK